ncbi:MAG: THUMP domain-containing protein [Candidatus Methanomethylicaceae archaeon]|nr:THUMP domain-containing protein [Candidatus Verstraetearchaeota archaeon]
MIAILLSGEHPSIPYSEVHAILKAEGMEFTEINRFNQLMIINAKKEVCEILKERGAYIIEGGEFLFSSKPSIDFLIKECEKIDWSLIKGKSFGVRVSRVKGFWREISSIEIEKIVGGIIKKNSDSRVNLENPDIWIRGIITDGGIFFYKCDFRVNRKSFYLRRPRKRPFFHPGVLDVKLSRAFVNLCRIKKGEIFLDPFCGTGGFLIEAAMMGMKAYGLDLDEKMILGARKNLNYYKLDVELILGDARNLPINKVDGISTDPPYGRGTSTKGSNIKDILNKFLDEAYRVLKNNRYMCIAAPKEIEIQEIIKLKGYEIQEIHIMKVHKSLTRSILVVKKYEC